MLEEVESSDVAPSVPRWEYTIIADRGRMHHVTVEELNEMGQEGWELVTIMPEERTQTPEIHFFFKRPVS